MLNRFLGRGVGVSLILSGMTLSSAGAVTIVLDYTYDTQNFFIPGSPARTALESAADFYTNLLQNNLSIIETPDPVVSVLQPQQLPPGGVPGVFTWNWSLNFTHPGNGSVVTLNDPTIPADEYRIYAGARSLSGNTLGEGGPGGFGWSAGPNANGYFTQSEIDLINITTDTFQSQVEDRGQTPGIFANWGGVITFDNDPQTQWNFDTVNLPDPGESDFLSVALHELAHTLGFGGTNEWRALTGLINDSPFFFGAKATAAYGQSIPLEADRVHWLDGTLSTIYGTQIVQEVAMDPTLTQGTRKLMTTLDVASLDDLGWVVPEPAMFSMVIIGSSLLLAGRRRAA